VTFGTTLSQSLMVRLVVSIAALISAAKAGPLVLSHILFVGKQFRLSGH
jgi:hypothetical protein